MRVSNGALFTNGDMSLSTLTSAPISLYSIFGYSIQLEFTGSPNGSFSVYVSSDPFTSNQAGLPAPTNFSLLADSTLSISAAGDIMYNINECNYNWFKIIYTKASGTGSLNGRFNLKGV